jgi:hypothetical protein
MPIEVEEVGQEATEAKDKISALSSEFRDIVWSVSTCARLPR